MTSISPTPRKGGLSGNLEKRDLSSSPNISVVAPSQKGNSDWVYRKNIQKFPYDETNDHIPWVKTAGMQRVKGLEEDEEEARRIRKKEKADEGDSESDSVGPSGEVDSSTEDSPHPTPLKTGLKPSTKVNPNSDKTKERRLENLSAPRAADKQRGRGPSQSLKSPHFLKTLKGDEETDLDKDLLPPRRRTTKREGTVTPSTLRPSANGFFSPPEPDSDDEGSGGYTDHGGDEE